jgi:hypothetical protein
LVGRWSDANAAVAKPMLKMVIAMSFDMVMLLFWCGSQHRK